MALFLVQGFHPEVDSHWSRGWSEAMDRLMSASYPKADCRSRCVCAAALGHVEGSALWAFAANGFVGRPILAQACPARLPAKRIRAVVLLEGDSAFSYRGSME